MLLGEAHGFSGLDGRLTTLLGHSGRSRSISSGGPQRTFLGLLPGAR